TFFARSIESVLTLFMMDSPNNCVCNYQFGALTPIWERPSHHPPLICLFLSLGGSRKFGYDKTGNITSKTVNGITNIY
ncbi:MULTISPECIES: hypothetical protein, partial [unclassified Pseudoalteromonas]|uniref:hypothetical protein n=1 Tax=unclassified Pseudoalteromonas TaxID=194690 RepID=UPI001F1A85D3